MESALRRKKKAPSQYTLEVRDPFAPRGKLRGWGVGPVDSCSCSSFHLLFIQSPLDLPCSQVYISKLSSPRTDTENLEIFSSRRARRSFSIPRDTLPLITRGSQGAVLKMCLDEGSSNISWISNIDIYFVPIFLLYFTYKIILDETTSILPNDIIFVQTVLKIMIHVWSTGKNPM